MKLYTSENKHTEAIRLGIDLDNRNANIQLARSLYLKHSRHPISLQCHNIPSKHIQDTWTPPLQTSQGINTEVSSQKLCPSTGSHGS